MAVEVRCQDFARCVFILAFLALSTGLVQSKKLLVSPTPGCHSHLMAMKKQAMEVAARGHDVKVHPQVQCR